MAAVCMGVAAVWATNNLLMVVMLAVAALISVVTVFLFKNRKRQALCTLPVMALLVAWYVVLAVYFSWKTLTWADAMPMVALLLVVLARKGIMDDEKLVRSLDRIR